MIRCAAIRRAAVAVLAAAALAACEREERRLTVSAAARQRPLPVRLTELQPGPNLPSRTVPAAAYEWNAYELAEGKRLYEWFNCVGCHAYGGGGSGPPLMDARWIYGSDPANVYATIVQGRPNGMPSFGGHIPDFQVWQLVAYVRSLGGLVTEAAAPGRSDAMNVKEPEVRKDAEPPTADAAEHPG